MDDDIVTARGIRIPAAAVSWKATRSGGPGGQHANTSDTQVVISLDLALADLPQRVAAKLRDSHGDVVTATSSDSRSQYRNRQLARQRLAELVDEAGKPVRKRRPTKPSRGSQRRRLEAKKEHSQKKQRRRWQPD